MVIVHEIEHQAQFANLGAKAAYERLIQEGIAYSKDIYDPYETPKGIQ